MIKKIYKGIYTAKSHVMHGDGFKKTKDEATGEVYENTVKFRTMPLVVTYDDKSCQIVDIPAISSNAVRNRLHYFCLLDLLERLEIKEKSLSKDNLYFLSKGYIALPNKNDGEDSDNGKTKKPAKKVSVDSLRHILYLETLIPFIPLFGYMESGTISKTSKLEVGPLYAVCDESAAKTGMEVSGLPAKELLKTVLYTRFDDYKRIVGDMLLERINDPEAVKQLLEQLRESTVKSLKGKDKKAQAIYYVEIVPAETKFVHEIVLRNTTELEEAALSAGIKRFAQDPYIGGGMAHSAGRMEFVYEPELPSPDPYYEYVENNKDEIREAVLTEIVD